MMSGRYGEAVKFQAGKGDSSNVLPRRSAIVFSDTVFRSP